jgi:hypothetical protein
MYVSLSLCVYACMRVCGCMCLCVCGVRDCVCACVSSCRFEVDFSSGLWPIIQAISWGLCQVRINRLLLTCARCRCRLQLAVQNTRTELAWKLKSEAEAGLPGSRRRCAVCLVCTINKHQAPRHHHQPPRCTLSIKCPYSYSPRNPSAFPTCKLPHIMQLRVVACVCVCACFTLRWALLTISHSASALAICHVHVHVHVYGSAAACWIIDPPNTDKHSHTGPKKQL